MYSGIENYLTLFINWTTLPFPVKVTADVYWRSYKTSVDVLEFSQATDLLLIMDYDVHWYTTQAQSGKPWANSPYPYVVWGVYHNFFSL